jgi:hypothetical protein
MQATTTILSSWFIQGKKRLRFASAAGNIGITLTVVLIWNVILQGYLSPFYLQQHTYERRISFSSNAKTPTYNMIVPDLNDPYLNIMVHDERLVRSAQHQSKFLARRNDSLPYIFPRELLFPTTTGRAAAFIINTDFAYVRKYMQPL